MKAANQLVINKVEFLKTMPLFLDLGPKTLKGFASSCISCSFKKGEIIYSEGQEPKFIYMFKSGKIMFFTNTPSGKTIIANIISTATFCGITNLSIDDPYWTSAKALENINGLRVRRYDFINLINHNHKIAWELIKLLEISLRSGFNRYISALTTSSEQRVLDMLYDLSNKFGLSVPLNDEEIAFLTGTTRETTTRAISRLKMKGIVKKYRGRLQVLDPISLYNLKQYYPVI